MEAFFKALKTIGCDAGFPLRSVDNLIPFFVFVDVTIKWWLFNECPLVFIYCISQYFSTLCKEMPTIIVLVFTFHIFNDRKSLSLQIAFEWTLKVISTFCVSVASSSREFNLSRLSFIQIESSTDTNDDSNWLVSVGLRKTCLRLSRDSFLFFYFIYWNDSSVLIRMLVLFGKTVNFR